MESRALEDEWAVARLKDTAPASPASPSTSAPSQNHKNQFHWHWQSAANGLRPAGSEVDTPNWSLDHMLFTAFPDLTFSVAKV